ncbi:MAG: histidine kinase [Chitinispirillaceae bacterium]|nr:histidine kinase [Chitinispirillaceae bacterium]
MLTCSAEIDFPALLESFKVISDELCLDRLLEKLIRIVMENVGAQRGVLLLENHGIFFVRAEGVLRINGADAASHIESHAVNIASERFPLPQGIILYVQHSREPVRLENASVHDRFIHDPYIKTRTIRSALCFPLVNKGRVRGIIYLENNMLEAAFPSSCLPLLKILCGHAIISIENVLFHDLEIGRLKSRVNPHFLFNALSSIAELCHTDPDAAEDAVITLSTLYRYVLTAEMRLVTLEEELDIVNKYLTIEKLRFGDRLSYEVRISGDPSPVRIPCMLIQPLVENSITNGIIPRIAGGAVTITIAITNERCSVAVENDGQGPDTSAPQTGYSLDSIRKRLELQYRHDAVFEISDAEGFKVHVSLPVTPA